MIRRSAACRAPRLLSLSAPLLCVLLGALALAVPSGRALAQIGSDRYAAVVMDARTGRVLIAANADEPRYPASLTKMMTLYLVFEALRDGRLHLDTRIRMSEEAASRPPSKLGLPPGASLTVEQAILALVTKSANDVATAVAEHIAGSEARFAQLMTLRARAIGMTRTTFRNASGLPDPGNVSTARDLATLGLRLLRDFPDRYHYFSRAYFTWGRMTIRNHNRMLGDYEGADGIKTGYIRDSGFNIVTSAQRDGVRLIGVTMGGSSWVERDRHMAALLDQGFAQMGVAGRPPVSVMAAATPVLRSARAATNPRADAARARHLRDRPPRGTAAAAAPRAETPTPPRSMGRAAAASPPRAAPRRAAAARPAARIEQGSRAASPVSARRGSLPAPARQPITAARR
jgi:D-alanyl-D-alanine carboxypeptidase